MILFYSTLPAEVKDPTTSLQQVTVGKQPPPPPPPPILGVTESDVCTPYIMKANPQRYFMLAG